MAKVHEDHPIGTVVYPYGSSQRVGKVIARVTNRVFRGGVMMDEVTVTVRWHDGEVERVRASSVHRIEDLIAEHERRAGAARVGLAKGQAIGDVPLMGVPS